MCQVDEEYSGQLEHRELPSGSKNCVKCKEAPAAVVIKPGDAFCRGCFKDYFIHKFRAMLGKNRIIFPGEKVLLAVSGGPSSSAMLNQVQEGLSQNAHKKLRFIPGIVYIDEGAALGQSMEKRQKTVAEMKSLFKTTGFPYYITALEQVLNLPSSVLEPASSAPEWPMDSYKASVDRFIQTDHSHCLSPEKQADLSDLSIQEDCPAPLLTDESNTQLLQKLFCSVKTLTAKEDLLHTIRQHLLVHTARTEGYSKLMFGENCTRLAVKLLASMSLGRGAQLAVDTGFADPRYGDIITVRPMRDYSAKEISFYNHMCNVPCVFIPTLETKTTEKASIQRLTESFVIKLQADFPSTVSTIYRTSEKLQTAYPSQNASTTDSWDKCLLCMCALDTTVEEASAFQATLISEQLSLRGNSGASNTRTRTRTQGPTAAPAPPGQCCFSVEKEGGGEGFGVTGYEGGSSSSAKAPETMELENLLCYSCRLTIKDMSSVEVLPQYIMSEAQRRRKRRSQLREKIGEFLLDEDKDYEGEEAKSLEEYS
ncbi:cytoplasmic tRNA 2-thiolation protein 2 isoform 2-T2 [Polymixia lowei]